MILTQSNFHRIKENEKYKLNFNSYFTIESFNNYIKKTLETENINILINNIIRVVNIINEVEEDNAELEIKELILKANLSKNIENFKYILSFLDKSSDEKILRINRVIDKTLLKNIDTKLELLIKLEKLSEYFYPSFSDKLIMNRFKEIPKEEEIEIEEEIETSPALNKEKKTIIGLLFVVGLLFIVELLFIGGVLCLYEKIYHQTLP
jgi:hypothetical protein